jgi:hypothetical protein
VNRERMIYLQRRIIAAMIAVSLEVPSLCAAQATKPTGAIGRSTKAILDDIDTAHHQFTASRVTAADISDPVRRKAIAPTIIPPLKTMVADYTELGILEPKMQTQARRIRQQFLAYLSVLGDQESIDQVKKMTDSKDIGESLDGQASQLLARWVSAGTDETAETKLTDELQTLDQAHPENEDLTSLTFTLCRSTLSHPLSQRLLQMAEDMKNPSADKLRSHVNTSATRP